MKSQRPSGILTTDINSSTPVYGFDDGSLSSRTQANEISPISIKDVTVVRLPNSPDARNTYFLFVGVYFWTSAMLSNKTVLGFPSKEEALIYRDKNFDEWVKTDFCYTSGYNYEHIYN